MAGILNWSLMSSGVIGLALVSRAMLKCKMKKTWLSALWIIVLVRLLLPILPSSSLSLFNLWGRIDSQSHTISNQNTIVNTDTGTLPIYSTDDEGIFSNVEVMGQEKGTSQINPNIANETGIEKILLGLWIAGMIVILSYFSIGYYQLRKKINHLETVEEADLLALLADFKRTLHIKADIKLVKGEYPFIFGLIRPTICISNIQTRQDIEMMLLHELMHFKYKDNILTYLHIVVCAIHWFNPLVWMTIKLMKHDMELACDERVLEIGANRKQYANTLLNITLTPQRETYWVQGMGENMNQIKSRLLQIATFKKPKLSVTIIGSILLIIGGIVCLTNAQQPKVSTEGKIEPVQEAGWQEKNQSEVRTWQNEDAKNIAVFGLDERQSLTDAIIVINLDKKQGTLKVISIPRNTKVEWDEEEKAVVGFTAPHVITKINEMYGYAGGKSTDKLAAKEIEKLLNIQVDDVIIVDFKTVEKVIDELGGVNIELTEDMRYTDNAAGLYINLKKGKQQLDGEQTLQAIRYRMYPEGDLGRINMQQQIMKALLEKLLEENNPGRLVEIASELLNNIETTISLEALPSYIQILLAAKPNQITFYTLPGEGNVEGGISYFLPDLKQSTTLLH